MSTIHNKQIKEKACLVIKLWNSSTDTKIEEDWDNWVAFWYLTIGATTTCLPGSENLESEVRMQQFNLIWFEGKENKRVLG